MEKEFKSETNNQFERDNIEELQNKVFLQLGSDRQVRGIIADLSRGNMSERDNVEANDVGNLVRKYPEKSGYESASDNFLNRLSQRNTPQKVEEYVGASAKLELALYGSDDEASASDNVNEVSGSGLWELEKGSTPKASLLTPEDMPHYLRNNK